MELQILNFSGDKGVKIKVDETVFGIKPNESVVHQAIVAELSIGGVKVATGTVAPGETQTLSLPSGFSSSNNLPLTMVASSGTSADLTTSCAPILVVQ